MGEVIFNNWPRSRTRASVYCIEGENLTMKEIAQRVGCSVSVASSRLNKAKTMPGPVTWKRLGK